MIRPECIVLAGAVGLAAGVGCTEPAGPQATPVQQRWEAPRAEPSVPPVARDPETQSEVRDPGTPSSAPAGSPIAMVNGRPIARDRFMALLVECHGLRVLECLVHLEAARQRAAEMGLSVTEADIAAAHSNALNRLASPVNGPEQETLDEAVARRLLEQFLEAKNISRREWDLRMEHRAYLARIARAEVETLEITEPMLRQEYERLYGPRVRVRHIQLSSMAAVRRARALLATEAFETVARRMSENDLTAARGGLLPPFTQNDPTVPPAIREMAFRLEVGEVSPAVSEQNMFHLIKLEERIAATGRRFESADHDALRRSLRDRLVAQRIDDLDVELFDQAAIDIRDPVLRAQFQRAHRGGR